MGRTLAYPLAGFGLGFLAAVILVQIMTPAPRSDTAGVTLFIGAFLAGTGSIAGAIVACKRE
jgi:hypothetical protein